MRLFVNPHEMSSYKLIRVASNLVFFYVASTICLSFCPSCACDLRVAIRACSRHVFRVHRHLVAACDACAYVYVCACGAVHLPQVSVVFAPVHAHVLGDDCHGVSCEPLSAKTAKALPHGQRAIWKTARSGTAVTGCGVVCVCVWCVCVTTHG